MKSLKLFCMVLDDVGEQYQTLKPSLARDRQTVCRRYEHEGFAFLSKTLPTLGDAIFIALENGKFDCPTSFKKKGALPLLLGGLLELVFDGDTGFLKEDVDVGALCELRQLCYLFKKALGTPRDEESLDEQARAAFISVEGDIHSDIPYRQEIQAISRLMWLPTSFDDVVAAYPRNGPGGVSEGLFMNQKYGHLVNQYTASALYSEMFDFTFFELNAREGARRNRKSDHARLLTVPKSSTARRTITIEPCCRMFIQQMFNSVIRRKIKNRPSLRSTLHLNDQSVSRERALRSSVTLEWATVDLSSASDRLSLSLVETVFAHDTVLLEGLRMSRTPTVLDGLTVYDLKKYAGMGNATTFPVQSIVFTVLAVLAILRVRNKTVNKRNVDGALSEVTVYGDDIITPTDSYLVLVEIMHSLGLRVNERKSFVNSHFRESCGLDAYNGVDITPIYVRHDLDSEMDPSAIISAVATGNQLFHRGYYHAANYAKCLVEGHTGPLPLTRNSSSCLGWHTRQDAQEYGRFNVDLHRFETRGVIPTTAGKVDPLDGVPGLLMSLLRQDLSEQQHPTEKTPIRGAIRFKRRWTV